MITIYVSAKHAVNCSDRHYAVTVKAKDEPSAVDKVVSRTAGQGRDDRHRCSAGSRRRASHRRHLLGSLRLEALGRPRCAV